MIYLLFAVLLLATLAAVLFPLFRTRVGSLSSRADHEVSIYRDQLRGLDHEIERGLITELQAEAARLEIQRRILDATKNQTEPARPDNIRMNVVIAVVVALVFSIGSWQLYAYLGAPGLPDRPFASRQNDPDMQMGAAAEVIAAELEANPNEDGYRQLADMFLVLHRYDRAAEACRKAIDLGAHDAKIWSRLGESLVRENDGAVVMDAQKAFKAALSQNKNDPGAQFYMGLAEAQIGDTKKAVAIWRNLEKTMPPDAAGLPMVRENIDFYAKQGGFDPASVPPAQP